MNRAYSRVLVTRGASFIASALADALVERDAKVRVIDNLSSGKLDNIQHHTINWYFRTETSEEEATTLAQMLTERTPKLTELANEVATAD